MRQADQRKRGGHALFHLGARQTPLLQAEGDVARHRHMRPERVGLEHHADVALPRRHVEYILAADDDGAVLRLVEAGDEAQ